MEHSVYLSHKEHQSFVGVRRLGESSYESASADIQEAWVLDLKVWQRNEYWDDLPLTPMRKQQLFCLHALKHLLAQVFM